MYTLRKNLIYSVRSSNRCILNGGNIRYEHSSSKQRKHNDDGFRGEKDGSSKRSLKLKHSKNSSSGSNDNEESNKNKNNAEAGAVYVTKLGAAVNVALASSKGLIGYAVGSTGLIADAVNSLGDLLTDAVVLFTVKEARRGSSKENPWGKGKLEPLGALTVGALLLSTGGGIGFSAGQAIFEIVNAAAPTIVDSAAAAAAGGAVGGGGVATRGLGDGMMEAALAVSAISIVAKELLFRATLKAGTIAKSSAVIANAYQHRADVGVSMAVFCGLVGKGLGYELMDPIAGVFVSAVVVRQAVLVASEAISDLSDSPADQAETDMLIATCKSVNGVSSVEELLARRSGPFLFIETTIGVPGEITASAAHRVAEIVRSEIMSNHGDRVARVVVHVEPLGSQGMGEKSQLSTSNHTIEVANILREKVPEIKSISDTFVYYKNDGMVSLKVDVCMDDSLSIRQAHIVATKARSLIMKSIPGVLDVDVDLELDEHIIDSDYYNNNYRNSHSDR